MRKATIKPGVQLADYLAYTDLLPAFNSFHNEALLLKQRLRRRRVWMVSSTEQGGGVAEMMPRMISLLRQLGIKAEWLILETDEADFFPFTKKLHNLIHGEGSPEITAEETAGYERVNRHNAKALAHYVQKNDIVVLHDPQPAGMATELKKLIDATIIWRSHIGLDFSNAGTDAAWSFLRPYLASCDHYVFSAPEYIPEGLSGNVTIIHPSLDPLSHKNRELSLHKLTGILNNAGLLSTAHPTIYPAFKHPVIRLQPDGTFVSAQQGEDVGLLFRPIITQVSRWDRLKGFLPLMQGFAELKRHPSTYTDAAQKNHRRIAHRIKNARLVLAGPDPDFVNDDPEGEQVLKELVDFYTTLSPTVQQDIVVLKLPMQSAKENALIVNALQRCSYAVVQNSLREGFGLTATEAMWKRIPVLVSSACGLRTQVRDGIDGLLVDDPEDANQIATRLGTLVSEPKRAEAMGFSAQQRVREHFLTFQQISQWLTLFSRVMS
ncbi:MAG: glycosyltransferase [Tunicatimonas sp.]